MRLTVLSVAYPFAPVGPHAVGGAEQVLSHLDHALVAAGHRSLVVACEGSETAGTLLPVPTVEGRLDEPAKAAAHRRHRQAIAEALARWPVDVVHLHGVDFHAYWPPAGVPALATLHLPPSWYPPEALRPSRPDTWLHCVSAAQHAACPPGPHLLPPIDNGVPVELLAARHAKRPFALMLGRICPEKGVHLAIEAARRADMTLLIGGEVFAYEAHQRYFADEVAPRLDRRRRFLGPVGFARKRRLLTAASCLVVPALAPETSSLVAREALACGTPVVAFPNGALPDAVEHGRTGFLVNSVEEMAEAMHAAAELSPALCRQVARERFSLTPMVARYLDVYEQLARTGRAGAAPPLPVSSSVHRASGALLAEGSGHVRPVVSVSSPGRRRRGKGIQKGLRNPLGPLPSRCAAAGDDTEGRQAQRELCAEMRPMGEVGPEARVRGAASSDTAQPLTRRAPRVELSPGRGEGKPPIGIHVEEVTSTDALAGLAPAWWDLWRNLPSATPFQSPAWLLPWWHCFSPGDLFTLAVRRGDRLIGLAPSYIEQSPLGRRILPIGISLSDYLDVLVDPEHALDVGGAIAGHLQDRRAVWDSWELEELAPNATGLGLAAPDGCEDAVSIQSACPVLVLHPGPGALKASVPASKLRKLRMARNRADRRGSVELSAVDAGSLDAFLAALFRLHGARWQRRGESGVLADAAVRRFHEEAAPALLAAGLARFSLLRIAGSVAGAYYGLHHRERAYAYLGGFDPAFSFESPGTILVGYAIEQAVKDGACEFHFLRGQEAYKYEWGATDRWNRRRSVRLHEARRRRG